jgi:hypothetical protein
MRISDIRLNVKTWTEGDDTITTWQEPNGFAYKETLSPVPTTLMLQELECTDPNGMRWTTYDYLDPADPDYLPPSVLNYLDEACE